MSAAIKQAALRWLLERRPPGPFELKRRVVRAVEWTDCEAPTIAEVLATAGLDSLQRAVREGEKRSAANDLLAADALITYACEAAAEEGADALSTLLDGLEIARFDALAPDRVP